MKENRSLANEQGAPLSTECPRWSNLMQRAELVAQLQQLGPAWGELRAVLNEVNRIMEP